ncbi:MAG: oligosaccharide flippase family protein [Acholeplasma sp.]|nr:oligosaccharide flippase family protein [Acholeplasma sp.]
MKNNKVFKAGIGYVLVSIITKGLSVLTLPIYTRIIPQNDFGIINTYYSWVSILLVVISIDFTTSILIAKNDYNTNDFKKYNSNIILSSSMNVILFYLLFLIFRNSITGILNLPEVLIHLLFLDIFVTNIFVLNQMINRVDYSYKKFIVLALVTAFVSPMLSVPILLIINENQYLFKILGDIFPKIIISIILLMPELKKIKCLDKKFINYGLRIAIPLIPHQISGMILNQFDRVLISKFNGYTDTAIYSLSYSYASLLSVVWIALNSAWSPWFFEKMKNDENIKIRDATKKYIYLLTFAYFPLLLISPELIRLFGPDEYLPGLVIVPIVLYGMAFQFTYSLYVNIQYYYKNLWFITTVTIVSAGVNFVLNFYFIPVYGYIAASVTTLISLFIIFIAHFILTNIKYKQKVVNNIFVFKILLFISIITSLFYLCIDNLMYRLILLLICWIIIIYLNGRYIKDVLRRGNL